MSIDNKEIKEFQEEYLTSTRERLKQLEKLKTEIISFSDGNDKDRLLTKVNHNITELKQKVAEIIKELNVS